MELKRYSFPFTVLDDQGHERTQRLATDSDVEKLLGGSGQTSPSEHLDALARQEMDTHPVLSYRQALDRVMQRNPTVVRLYASESGGRLRVYAGDTARAG